MIVTSDTIETLAPNDKHFDDDGLTEGELMLSFLLLFFATIPLLIIRATDYVVRK